MPPPPFVYLFILYSLCCPEALLLLHQERPWYSRVSFPLPSCTVPRGREAPRQEIPTVEWLLNPPQPHLTRHHWQQGRWENLLRPVLPLPLVPMARKVGAKCLWLPASSIVTSMLSRLQRDFSWCSRQKFSLVHVRRSENYVGNYTALCRPSSSYTW